MTFEVGKLNLGPFSMVREEIRFTPPHRLVSRGSEKPNILALKVLAGWKGGSIGSKMAV